MSLKSLNMKVSILDELKIPYYVQITKGRKLSIKYDKNGKVKILKPANYPTDEAIKFIEKNIDWITSHYEKYQPVERKYIDFSVQGTKIKKAIRYVLGVAVVALTMYIFKAFLPEGAVFRVIRYAIIGFTASATLPYLFKKINL